MSLFYNQLIAFAVGIASSILASVFYTLAINRYETQFSFRRIVELVLDLANQIQNDNFQPDFIFAIDRNSTITGGILAGHIGLKTVISIATENTRQANGARVITIANGFAPSGNFFANKKILVFICFNDSGTSLEAVYRFAVSMRGAPAEVRTAALFTSSSPRFMPKYYARKVGVNLKTPINALMPKMPWVTRTWKHVFGSERLGR